MKELVGMYGATIEVGDAHPGEAFTVRLPRHRQAVSQSSEIWFVALLVQGGSDERARGFTGIGGFRHGEVGSGPRGRRCSMLAFRRFDQIDGRGTMRQGTSLKSEPRGM
ncbi:MAG: hypothetical protein M3083_00385 [Actinomycetota bacterium]|nr:hypothetical protein [Actinomycetota bacterium]